jgi:FkbM family methyltransferase
MIPLRQIFDNVQESVGLRRSVLLYYNLPFHQRALTRFYAQFIKPGDLCFDVGAHVGNRVRAWSKLGARVVAVEPQPQCMRLLRRWYGGQPNIVLLEQALGATPGTDTLWISRRTPTVSTTSQPWLATVQHTNGFSTVRWDRQVPIAVTTLDTLIEQHGEPVFSKIDVEGGELDVLRGLTRPLKALSFEYLPAAIDGAHGCIERLNQLARYEYNWSVSEWPWLRSRTWLSPQQMAAHLQRLAHGTTSGDVYARRIG